MFSILLPVCDICGQSVAMFMCGRCDNKQLCTACDERWHQHPKRKNHDRQKLRVLKPRFRLSETKHIFSFTIFSLHMKSLYQVYDVLSFEIIFADVEYRTELGWPWISVSQREPCSYSFTYPTANTRPAAARSTAVRHARRHPKSAILLHQWTTSILYKADRDSIFHWFQCKPVSLCNVCQQ